MTSCGTVARAESRRAWPAYTPPSSGSTSRSTTSSPSRLATRSPTERSSSTAMPARSASTRASPSSERTPDSRSSRRSTGTPITERGSGRSAPRVQIRDDCTAGCTTSSPSSRASATPSGRRLSIASAPTSTTTPPTSVRRSLPPGSGAASSTVTSWPSLAEDVGRGQPGEPTAHDQYPHGSSLADLVPPRPGAGRGGTRSLRRVRTAVRTRCGGRPAAETCPCVQPRGAAGSRSCGRRPRPRGRRCSRSGRAPRPG